MVNGTKYLEFANPEDIAPDGTTDNTTATPAPGQNKTTPTEKIGSSLTSKYQGDDPSKAPSRANSNINRDGFKNGSREWTFLDDLATFGAILGHEWNPDNTAPGAQSGGIQGGKSGGKPSPVAQILYFAIQLISVIGLSRVSGMAIKGARAARSATVALFRLLNRSARAKVVYSYGGEFSVTKLGWEGYPAARGNPPPGPFNFLDDAQYEANRAAANAANEQINAANKLGKSHGVWSEIHEKQPVRFGGSPTDPANKELLSPPEHWEVSAFWIKMQNWITRGP